MAPRMAATANPWPLSGACWPEGVGGRDPGDLSRSSSNDPARRASKTSHRRGHARAYSRRRCALARQKPTPDRLIGWEAPSGRSSQAAGWPRPRAAGNRLQDELRSRRKRLASKQGLGLEDGELFRLWQSPASTRFVCDITGKPIGDRFAYLGADLPVAGQPPAILAPAVTGGTQTRYCHTGRQAHLRLAASGSPYRRPALDVLPRGRNLTKPTPRLVPSRKPSPKGVKLADEFGPAATCKITAIWPLRLESSILWWARPPCARPGEEFADGAGPARWSARFGMWAQSASLGRRSPADRELERPTAST